MQTAMDSDTREEPRSEPKSEAKSEPRSEPKSEPKSEAPRRDPSITIPTAAALRTERAFAFGVAVVPFVGLLAAIAWHVVTVTDLAIAVVMYAITGFGITVGFHRLFTHKSFECPKWVKAAFQIAGSMAVEGPAIRWVADHRRHHAFSDRPGDPHSPHLRERHGVAGTLSELWHAHIGWFFDAEKTRIKRFAPDLLVDRDVTRIDKRYFTWMFLTLAIPFVLGAVATQSLRGALSALLWGGLVRVFFVHHVTWSINSICHVFGNRPFETRDKSSNVAWLAIPSLGESWHNGHHAFPTSAVHGLGRFQIDLSALLISMLERLGLAWNVKRPTAAQVEDRRVAAT
jgi:stearoyl-CoA desaturase (Delta-9 desaturase)